MTTVVDLAPPWAHAAAAGAPLPDGAPLEGSANLLGMLQGWRDYPLGMDFLHRDSPNRRWKALQTSLLCRRVPALLDGGPGRRILDLACGSGRFLVPQRALGSEVVGLDLCRPSLDAAARHLGRLPEALPEARLLHADASDPASFEGALGDGLFDAAFLIELLCYLPDPRELLTHLPRWLRPGATVVATVEAWPGALLADFSGLAMVDLPAAARTHVLHNPGERWVRACVRGELSAMLGAAGFSVLSEEGLCWLPDGPFLALVDPDRGDLADEQAAVAEIEDMLRDDPHLAMLPRCWVAVARWEG